MKKGLLNKIGLLWLSALLFALPAFCEAPDAVLFVNVGAADATIIRHEGQIILIDTGSKESAPKLLAALRHMGAQKVDAVFLTHSHQDHVGGLAALRQAFPVDRVYCAQIGKINKKGRHKTAAAARKQGWEPIMLAFGDTVKIGSLSLDVLGPLTENTLDDNDNSLVLKTVIDGTSYLFTGDMQFPEEKTLLSAHVNVKADVLKVGNHGNPDATLPEFARAVAPDLAVIPTDTTEDKNSANPRVMKALMPADIRVTQQAQLGILVETTKEGLTASLLPLDAAVIKDVTLVVDKEQQTITLKGEGDLGGAVLYSNRGGETFVFPERTMLCGLLTVGAKGSNADLTWPEKQPIHPTKSDDIFLFDRHGHSVAEGS